MIKLSYNRNLKRAEHLNDSGNNLIGKCSNENCTIKGNFQVFRHCTRYSTHFCSQCCDLSEKIFKLLEEQSDNYWLCPNCTKPALNAVFVEKDIKIKCQIYLEPFERRIKKLKKIIYLSLTLWKPS